MTSSGYSTSAPAVSLQFFCSQSGNSCQGIHTLIDELKQRVGQHVEFVVNDIDHSTAMAEQFGIISLPAYVLLRNGQVIWQGSGLQPAHALMAILSQRLM